MKIIGNCKQINEWLEAQRTEIERIGKADSLKVGFVPTMGALHSGHISLVTKAKSECDVVVVSVFVNPTQFNDPNDLKSYPRTPEADAQMLAKAGADVVFMPTVDQIYPEPDTRVFDFGQIDKVMEGASRPGHFNGVAQVVSRLFDIVKPHKAYFGEKDFQQIAVINAMVAQLELDVEIVSCPIIRDIDGLALSSRNALLTPQHRVVAPEIYAALKSGVAQMNSLSPAEVERFVSEMINKNPLLNVIYFEIVDADSLQRVSSWSRHRAIQGCITVQAGAVRLIDNIKFR